MAYQVKIIDSIKPIPPVPVEFKANFSSFQALKGILKLCKVPSVKVPLDHLVSESNELGVSKPGIREDNAVLQYRGDMTEADLYTLRLDIGPEETVSDI